MVLNSSMFTSDVPLLLELIKFMTDHPHTMTVPFESVLKFCVNCKHSSFVLDAHSQALFNKLVEGKQLNFDHLYNQRDFSELCIKAAKVPGAFAPNTVTLNDELLLDCLLLDDFHIMSFVNDAFTNVVTPKDIGSLVKNVLFSSTDEIRYPLLRYLLTGEQPLGINLDFNALRAKEKDTLFTLSCQFLRNRSSFIDWLRSTDDWNWVINNQRYYFPLIKLIVSSVDVHSFKKLFPKHSKWWLIIFSESVTNKILACVQENGESFLSKLVQNGDVRSFSGRCPEPINLGLSEPPSRNDERSEEGPDLLANPLMDLYHMLMDSLNHDHDHVVGYNSCCAECYCD